MPAPVPRCGQEARSRRNLLRRRPPPRWRRFDDAELAPRTSPKASLHPRNCLHFPLRSLQQRTATLRKRTQHPQPSRKGHGTWARSLLQTQATLRRGCAHALRTKMSRNSGQLARWYSLPKLQRPLPKRSGPLPKLRGTLRSGGGTVASSSRLRSASPARARQARRLGEDRAPRGAARRALGRTPACPRLFLRERTRGVPVPDPTSPVSS